METRTLSTALLQTQHDLHCTADSETIEKNKKEKMYLQNWLTWSKIIFNTIKSSELLFKEVLRETAVCDCVLGVFVFYYQLVVVELWSIMSCHEPPGSSSNCCSPYITCKTERDKGTEMQLYQ